MSRRISLSLIVIRGLLVGSFALAQTVEEPLEKLFNRNPLKAIWTEMRAHSLESAEQGEAIASDLESLQGSVAGIGGVIEGVAASQAIADAMQARIEPSCAGLDVASVQICRGVSCDVAMTYPCAPFACDEATGTCRDRCSANRDCATASACQQAAGQCVYEGYTCADGYSVRQPNGSVASCNGYRCLAGGCQQQCQYDRDCKEDEGFRCVAHSCERP